MKDSKYNVIFLFNCTISGLFNIVIVFNSISDLIVLHSILILSEFDIPAVLKEHKEFASNLSISSMLYRQGK